MLARSCDGERRDWFGMLAMRDWSLLTATAEQTPIPHAMATQSLTRGLLRMTSFLEPRGGSGLRLVTKRPKAVCPGPSRRENHTNARRTGRMLHNPVRGYLRSPSRAMVARYRATSLSAR